MPWRPTNVRGRVVWLWEFMKSENLALAKNPRSLTGEVELEQAEMGEGKEEEEFLAEGDLTF